MTPQAETERAIGMAASSYPESYSADVEVEGIVYRFDLVVNEQHLLVTPETYLQPAEYDSSAYYVMENLEGVYEDCEPADEKKLSNFRHFFDTIFDYIYG